MEKRLIDARGLACPLPVVNTKKAIGEFKEEGILTVLVDNEIAVQNLKKFAAQKGLAAAGEKKSDTQYQVTIQIPPKPSSTSPTAAPVNPQPDQGQPNQKQANQAQPDQLNQPQPDQLQPDQPDQETCTPDSRKKGMVAILSANMMGNGDAKLGKALMKAFIFALTKQDTLPETIVCYNSGAYLTCQGSDSLEDFKNLEAEGVTIVTCGTCLDFYGIKDRLAVGTITNMYEIVEIMEQATSILRP